MTLSIENIRVLPEPALRLIGTSRKHVEILKKHLQGILEKDRALSAVFLKAVNSSFFSFPQKIVTIQEALGLGDPMSFRNILLCALMVRDARSRRPSAAFHSNEFLWHSLQCAFLANMTAKQAHYALPEEAFLIGYVHDIGKLILLEAYAEKYDILLEVCRSAPDLLLDSERRLDGTHPQLAVWFLGHWNLPSYMTDPILYHHEPVERVADALPLVKIVYVAHTLCGEPDLLKRYEVAEELLGLGKRAVLELLKASKDKARELAECLELGAEPPAPGEEGLHREGLAVERAVALRTRDALFFVEAIDNFLRRKEGDPILQILLVGMRKVLGTPRLLVFQLDSRRQSLLCRMLDEGGNLVLVEDLSISMKSEKSLVVRSLAEARILTSFDSLSREGLPLSDEQIARFLGTNGIVCLGMRDRDRPGGVIVVGLDSREFPAFKDRVPVLHLMVQHAALLLRLEEADGNLTRAEKDAEHLRHPAIPRDVYHEVNNPLSIIKNYLKILSIKLSDRQMAQEEIKIISEEIDRITKILRERAEPSKVRVSKPEPVEVNGLLADLLRISRATFMQHSGIEVVLDLEKSQPFVLAEKDGLKQVFINLFKNALEAMPKGGRLKIQTRRIQAFSEKGGEGLVEIIFADNGPGVPDDIKGRIFEPFVSSKGENHSGLGLPICQSILREMKGSITYEGGVGQGSTFRVKLPAAMNKAPVPGPHRNKP